MTICELSMQASDGRNATIECGMSGLLKIVDLINEAQAAAGESADTTAYEPFMMSSRTLARVIAKFRAHGGERQVRWFAQGDVTYTGLGELLDALKEKAMWEVSYGVY
jgi:hypothetical protein